MNVYYGCRFFCPGSVFSLGPIDGCRGVRQVLVGSGLEDLVTTFMKNSS
jgi:hypothetical protein